MSTALTVVEARDTWTAERLEVVKRQLCPSGVTDEELALFIEVCKRSGLDPFQKEIFCVPRRVNTGTKDNPRWVQKHEAQPAEAGMLARADRFPDFRGIKAAAVYSGDEILITEDTVTHRFNPAKRQGQLVGAWAQAFREGRVYPVEYVTLEAYRQATSQWNSKPDTMLVKCARAAALRRAYPNSFAGLYLKEEMPAEEFEVPAANSLPVRTRGLEAIPTKAGEAEKLSVPALATTSLPSEALLAGMPMDELATKAIEVEAWLQKFPKSRKREEAQMKLAALQAEISKRTAELEAPPHSDEDAPGES